MKMEMKMKMKVEMEMEPQDETFGLPFETTHLKLLCTVLRPHIGIGFQEGPG